MEYAKIIENNAFLKDYFTEFPKKLKQLAVQGNVLKLCENGIEIIDLNILADYLKSEASIFPIDSVYDFIETLHVLQFSKRFNAKNKISYTFVNPNFDEQSSIIPEDFYKQPIDITKVNDLNGTKRMRSCHHIGLINRLMLLNDRNKSKFTKLEYFRLKLKFELHKKLDSFGYKKGNLDYNIEEPEYQKNNDIAGYYGYVELSALKNGFCNYFPIYAAAGNNVEMEVQEQETINVPENSQMETSENQETPMVTENVDKPTNSRESENFEDDFKENVPPKKRRKHISQSAKITLKETNDALSNLLQKEFGAFSNNVE